MPSRLALYLLTAIVAPTGALAKDPVRQRIAALYGGIAHQVDDVPSVDGNAALASDDYVVLDVRKPAEIAVSRIPGAIVPAALPDAAALRGRQVLVYCTIGLRSGHATRDLRARGIDAVNLRGGILAWIADGGTIIDPDGTAVTRVHVFGRRWMALPSGYTAVW